MARPRLGGPEWALRVQTEARNATDGLHTPCVVVYHQVQYGPYALSAPSSLQNPRCNRKVTGGVQILC